MNDNSTKKKKSYCEFFHLRTFLCGRSCSKCLLSFLLFHCTLFIFFSVRHYQTIIAQPRYQMHNRLKFRNLFIFCTFHLPICKLFFLIFVKLESKIYITIRTAVYLLNLKQFLKCITCKVIY